MRVPTLRVAACGRSSGEVLQSAFLAHFLEYFLGGQHRLAHRRQADIAAKMQQRLGQFVLGPALAAGHAQVDGQFGPARLGGVGDDADQRLAS